MFRKVNIMLNNSNNSLGVCGKISIMKLNFFLPYTPMSKIKSPIRSYYLILGPQVSNPGTWNEARCKISCQTKKLSLDLQKLLIWFEYQNWGGLLRGYAVQTFIGWRSG